MQDVLVVCTVVVVGLLVGVELSVAAFLNPIFDRLPDNAGVAARSDGARVLGRVMPFWYIGAVFLGAWWAVQVWGRPAAPLIGIATTLLAASVVMSVLLLVPINARVARWSTEGVPPAWQQQVGRWDRLHHLRVAILIAAFALLVVGARA